eukprot:TRINITY_DN24787_c0_g1_i1.p1 TRINITY_DN24787_c0_g1~~TRINITY_DN24787_c0_g1_i1.p1  ORF type:complete len:229 (-),score=52.71 TRINITY_DN24787_c0_g1_i1:610-1296(-)
MNPYDNQQQGYPQSGYQQPLQQPQQPYGSEFAQPMGYQTPSSTGFSTNATYPQDPSFGGQSFTQPMSGAEMSGAEMGGELDSNEEVEIKREFDMMQDGSGHIAPEQVRGILDRFGGFGMDTQTINKVIWMLTGGSKIIGFAELILLILFIRRMRRGYNKGMTGGYNPVNMQSALQSSLPSQYQQFSYNNPQQQFASRGIDANQPMSFDQFLGLGVDAMSQGQQRQGSY